MLPPVTFTKVALRPTLRASVGLPTTVTFSLSCSWIEIVLPAL